jgi:hypothetical protein
MHLRASTLASRAGDADTTRAHLHAAAELSGKVPVVAPGTGATVRAAARKLRTDVANWQFTLVETHDIPESEGSADVVSSMLDRFVKGETARHRSGGHKRESTHAEAEAAVHLAVILVHWFVSGAIQSRPTP